MKKMLTGLQPTGAITLGNYVGAIKQMVENQNKYDSYLFVADMHAITVPQDREELHKNIKSLIAIYLACGIDPKKNKIYIQSENEYHANVSWLLECNTYYGELSRMTQFKDKSRKNANFSVGLLTYPVLMAADILINNKNAGDVAVKTFDNGTATINTDICTALGYDFDKISEAFKDHCLRIQTIVTAESFDDLKK